MNDLPHVAFTTTNGHTFVADLKDMERVLEKTWYYDKRARSVRSTRDNGKFVSLNMHLTGNIRTRHLNNNPLDFRRENLI